ATRSIDQADQWPALPLQQWKDTCATLHMGTQVIGKIRLALTPLINHWWNVPLYVNARGLTTSAIPYRNRPFELWFDFLDQELVLQMSDGVRKVLPLKPMSVADFYREAMSLMRSSGIEVRIWRMPVEVPDPRPGADLTREAYSHEVSSVGFWPGSGTVNDPAFYSYSAPEPAGFRDCPVRPAPARYDAQVGEFILMYEDVRTSASPSETLLHFCQSTYEAAATLAKWDRKALERTATL